ncbi:hypothetical protein [Streptomyces olivaceus]
MPVSTRTTGTPLRYYAAPADGPTTQAVRRLGALFQRELFDGFTPAQLAAADVPPLSPPFRERLARLAVNAEDGLPPAGLSLFLGAWGRLHGLVVLEVFGHTAFLEDHGSGIFRSSVRMTVEDVHRRIPAGAPAQGLSSPSRRPPEGRARRRQVRALGVPPAGGWGSAGRRPAYWSYVVAARCAEWGHLPRP